MDYKKLIFDSCGYDFDMDIEIYDGNHGYAVCGELDFLVPKKELEAIKKNNYYCTPEYFLICHVGNQIQPLEQVRRNIDKYCNHQKQKQTHKK